MNKILLGITLGFSLFFNQIVFADSSVCGESLSKMVNSINLDAGQKEKVKPILDQLQSNMKTLGSQMDSLEGQFKEQFNSANMDQNKVNDLVDQKTKLIGDMIKAKIGATNQIFAVLNPDQKTKLQDRIKKNHEKIAAEFKKCSQD